MAIVVLNRRRAARWIGYQSDVTRTGIFGKAPEKSGRRVYEIVRKAQDAASRLRRGAGTAIGQQWMTGARKVITDAGYGPDYKYFHRTASVMASDSTAMSILISFAEARTVA